MVLREAVLLTVCIVVFANQLRGRYGECMGRTPVETLKGVVYRAEATGVSEEGVRD